MASNPRPSSNSPILWPSHLAAERGMVYESLQPLYDQFHGPAGDTHPHMAFVVSSSRQSIFKENDPRGVIHKLEVSPTPNFATGKLQVTHEVLPGLNACSQIISVNPKLRAACFDQGCIVPIKNFGPGKTFNCDVRARLTHHTGQVSCLASNSAGTQIASGCTLGQITLYQVSDDNIEFLSRTSETSASFITALSYIQPSQEFSFGALNASTSAGETLLLYCTHDGLIGLIDTRCKLANDIKSEIIVTTNPRVNITSMAPMKSLPGHLIYFGGAFGEIIGCDLRMSGQYVYDHKRTEDGCIRRMKEVVIKDGNRTQTFLAHTTSTNTIRVLDSDNMKPDSGWICDRKPEGKVKDLVQVENKIVTCGEQTSIGCWNWNDSSSA